MKIAVLKLKLYAPWVHSLKEKRMIVKSLLAKLRNKFQVSAAIVPQSAQADSLMDEIVRFVKENTESEIVEEERERR